MMKNTMKLLLLVFFFAGTLVSCSKDDEGPDTTYPEIDLNFAESFPVQCSEITRGQAFTFKARFTDNAALGSYSLDIHHNFDHHTHSTEVNDCNEDPVKQPVNPMLFIRDYKIPEGSAEFVATTEISIPADVDPGDYHFMIRLTDREGWQTIRGISIKIK